jgi:hypothetical protein
MVAAARVTLVEELAAGGAPDWGSIVAEASRSVAAAVVAEVAIDPNAARFLVERVRDWIAGDDNELGALPAPSADDAHAMFSRNERKVVERFIAIETRLPIRQRALATFYAAFKPLLTAVIRQHRAAMETGLFEAHLLAGRGPGSQLVQLREQLGLLDGRLAAIGAAPSRSIAEGPQTVDLRAQRAALLAQIEQVRAANGADAEAAARAPIDAAAAGDDVAAWVALRKAIVAAGESCPPEVAESLGAVGLKAIQAGDPLFWCGVHASRMGQNPPGRDFTTS